MDAETIQAGLLHDSVEDTNLRLEEIEQIFGESVKNIVEVRNEVNMYIYGRCLAFQVALWELFC